MKFVFIALLVIHLLLHLLGFIKAFGIAEIPESPNHISKFQGIIWLLVSILYLPTLTLYILNNPIWSILALISSLISQVLIIMNWSDAKFGTIANLVILAVAIVHFAQWRFEGRYQNEVAQSFEEYPQETITWAHLENLPEPVKNYLEYVGVVDQQKVHNVRIVFDGEMREKDRNWFNFTSEQFNFTRSPARFFFMKARFKGIPTQGYHSFHISGARMQIKPLSLFSFTDHSSPEMFPTEMVTYLNDISLFAPAALIDPRISWEEIDDTSAKAIFKLKDEEVSAILVFNENNELINFISEDRYEVGIGQKLKFSTPAKDYQLLNGLRLPTYGEAIWHYPEGEFTYGKFKLRSVEYNVKSIDRS